MNGREKERDRFELNRSKHEWISAGKRDPFSIRQDKVASFKGRKGNLRVNRSEKIRVRTRIKRGDQIPARAVSSQEGQAHRPRDSLIQNIATRNFNTKGHECVKRTKCHLFQGLTRSTAKKPPRKNYTHFPYRKVLHPMKSCTSHSHPTTRSLAHCLLQGR